MKKTKLARCSAGLLRGSEPYVCLKPWPEEDCFVQCGKGGVVFKKGGLEEVLAEPAEGIVKTLAASVVPESDQHYTTAFFEAFPTTPMSTFLRGEGKTVEEAEAATWAQYEKMCACPADHTVESSFEKRNYTNGLGWCKTCRISKSKAFAPWEPCVECGTKTFWSEDREGQRICEECAETLPVERWDDSILMMRMGRWEEPTEWSATPEEIEAEYERRKAAKEGA